MTYSSTPAPVPSAESEISGQVNDYKGQLTDTFYNSLIIE